MDISYGRTYVTSELTRVALITVGLGDGCWRGPPTGLVPTRRQRVPIIGSVCMDECVVDGPVSLTPRFVMKLFTSNAREIMTLPVKRPGF